MTDQDIRRASLADLAAMKERGDLYHDPAVPVGEELDREFWDKAVVESPRRVRSVHLKIDADVFEFFRQQAGGKGHLTRMQKVLKAYADAHRR